MARTNPVEQREIEIGKRLAEAREDALVSRTALAAKLGLAQERLFKYETGLVPLPFWPGLEACRLLNINQNWLAVGTGPWSPFIALNWKKRLINLPKRSRFSEVYDQHMKPFVEHDTLIAAAVLEMKNWGMLNINDLYRSVAFAWLNEVPAPHAGEFIFRLAKAAERVIRDLKEKPVPPSPLAGIDPEVVTAWFDELDRRGKKAGAKKKL